MPGFSCECPFCGSRLKVTNPALVGKQVACPACDKLILLTPPTRAQRRVERCADALTRAARVTSRTPETEAPATQVRMWQKRLRSNLDSLRARWRRSRRANGPRHTAERPVPKWMQLLLCVLYFGLMVVLIDLVGGGYIRWPGCVNMRVEGDVTTLTYRSWVALLPLPFLAILPFLRPRDRRTSLRITLSYVGLVLFMFAVVTLFLSQILTGRVAIDSRHFSVTTAHWFRWSRAEMDFADLVEVQVVNHQSRRTFYYCLDCYTRAGGGYLNKRRIGMGGTLGLNGLDKIVEACRAHGIMAVGPPDPLTTRGMFFIIGAVAFIATLRWLARRIRATG